MFVLVYIVCIMYRLQYNVFVQYSLRSIPFRHHISEVRFILELTPPRPCIYV